MSELNNTFFTDEEIKEFESDDLDRIENLEFLDEFDVFNISFNSDLTRRSQFKKLYKTWSKDKESPLINPKLTTTEYRKQSIERWKEKRKRRSFKKRMISTNMHYATLKRSRINGRFMKKPKFVPITELYENQKEYVEKPSFISITEFYENQKKYNESIL